MSTISTRIQLTAVAFAVAATTTLTPAAVADPTNTDTGTATATSTDASVGNAAGQAPTRSSRKDRALPTSQAGGSESSSASTASTTPGGTSTATTPDRASTDVTVPAATSGASATGSNPLFQNPLIWFGSPNPTPPPATVIYNFEPIGNLPEFAQPMFGWLKDFNFEGCVLGLSNTVHGTVGPYGTATRSISTSGCA